ncbi:Alkaline phosphatase synthesis transcriptional regulatory protein phoP [uncultured Clostridium sp.]|nr:Alkaline phosphatase synthesis transcriptional regulatory protein phoP [uncultured Clostridium sp.]
MKEWIAVVEDEGAIARLLQINLEAAGYEVAVFQSGEDFLPRLKADWPDLLVLDWMLPGMDGLSVCRRVRETPACSALPILMLTAKSEEFDRVLGLEIGADDYMTKPFSLRELLARIKALLRRAHMQPTSTDQWLTYGTLSVNLSQHQAYCSDTQLELSPKEFDLLRQFLEHPTWAQSRDQLLEKIWGFDFTGGTRTVDMHIANLRKKIVEACGEDCIQTVRGVGYRLRGE